MSSFNQYKKRKSPSSIATTLVLVVVGLISVIYLVRIVVRSFVAQTPLVSLSPVIHSLLPKKTLIHEIVALQTSIESTNAQLEASQLEHAENLALKAELGRFPSERGILAHVITLPNRSFYDTMVIDAGSDNHIALGQTVFAFGAVALGTITDVSGDHATVQLFSAPGKLTSGSTNTSDVAVTLIGRGSGEYEVRIPRDVPFTLGELIAFQSVQTAVLAKIERIVTDPRDPFQRLIAKAPVNLQALKWVIVR